MVENHLEKLIIKHFDPKKADSIFSAEGEVIRAEGSMKWRKTIYIIVH